MSRDETSRPSKTRVVLLLCTVAIGAVVVAGFGITDRARSMQEVGTWTDQQAITTVHVVQPKRGPGVEQLVLPGTVNAYNTGTLFARASGYITGWHKDIGARVKKDDVLADISAPDLDQQLAEAKAQLLQLNAAVEQAQANADLGQANNQRTSRLVAQGWSSQALGDTDKYTAASRVAAVAVAKANAVAQEAAVGRLTELTRFKQIKAPFDGIVTARNVDIGDLVTAGGTSGRALFQISDLHRMRIYVNVPQAFLTDMKPGLKATLTLPGQKQSFTAELVSTSNSLAEGSRTALIELQADNPDGKLWPGAFAEVQFHIPSDQNTLRIPTTALVFGRRGLQVAKVDADHKIILETVELGRNLGTDVEVTKGIAATDQLVDNPVETTMSGETVQIAGEGKVTGDEKSASLSQKID